MDEWSQDRRSEFDPGDSQQRKIHEWRVRTTYVYASKGWVIDSLSLGQERVEEGEILDEFSNQKGMMINSSVKAKDRSP